MSDNQDLAISIRNDFSLQVPERISEEELRRVLAGRISELISVNFQELVRLLYRIDVSEAKLKQLLREHPEADAGLLIADLILERQAEKLKSRRQFRQREDDIPEEDKW
jgi:hypothetical protein